MVGKALSRALPALPGRGYGRHDPPLGSYLGLIALFNALFAGFLVVAKRAKRPVPDHIGLGDVLLLAVATHKLSRLLAKDRVLSGLRAPFTHYEGRGGPGEVEEDARGTGLRKAIGELVTCPYCLGLWVAAFFNYGLVLRPAETRLVGSIFTTLAIADFLQPLYVEATDPDEETEKKPEESGKK